MISWPSTMPKPLQSGFSMQPEDRRIASSTVGTSFQQGFGGDVCVAEVLLTLSPAQATWLEKFERDTLMQGTKWFSFPVWYAGGVHWEDCRFKTRPKASSINGFFGTYQFSLYVRRRTELMPDCMVKVFACFPPCFFVKLNGLVEDILLAAPSWPEEFTLHIAAVFAPVFTTLSYVTSDSVNDALSEILED